MSTQSDLIEELLFAEEDATLDFKRDQYPFEGADKEAKSEVLKDILAFVNAFRRADAYILIGVEEVRGGRSKVVGVQKQLDDAQLQQFVNSKTQMPVTFSYRATTHDGVAIGVIHIPVQARPVYAKANYGKIAKEAVYIRRGSSTGVAKPEEVVRMGTPAASPAGQPTVMLHLVDRDTGEYLDEKVLVADGSWIEVPSREDIPDYRPGTRVGSGMAGFIHHDPMANLDYYRDLAEYLQSESCFPATLELENTSGSVIYDASLELELVDPGGVYELLRSTDRPSWPEHRTMGLLRRVPMAMVQRDVHVRREGDAWKVDCRFGKIQAHARVRLEEDLLIGCRVPNDINIHGRVYGDNVVTPIAVGFSVCFSSGSCRLSVREIEDIGRSP